MFVICSGTRAVVVFPAPRASSPGALSFINDQGPKRDFPSDARPDSERGCILTMDQSYTESACIFSQWTDCIQEARVYSHVGPIVYRKREYILTLDQLYTGSPGIFSRWTNRIQEAQ
eukprot:8881249-Pyramimonas_sp.AAC.1